MIQHPWNVLFGAFLGPYSPKYCSILLKFWPEIVSNKTNTVFKKSFKILNFSLYGRHPTFTVLFDFGVQFTAGIRKILLKTKITAKSASLRISNNLIPKSRKNHRILLKLNKKTFFRAKLGLNWPLWPYQGVIWNSHMIYNKNISLHVMDVSFQFLCICSCGLYLEEALHFLVQDPIGLIFGGFGAKTPISNIRLSYNSDHGSSL